MLLDVDPPRRRTSRLQQLQLLEEKGKVAFVNQMLWASMRERVEVKFRDEVAFVSILVREKRNRRKGFFQLSSAFRSEANSEEFIAVSDSRRQQAREAAKRNGSPKASVPVLKIASLCSPVDHRRQQPAVGLESPCNAERH